MMYTRKGDLNKWKYIEDRDGDLFLEQVLLYIIRNATSSETIEEGQYQGCTKVTGLEEAARDVAEFMKQYK